MGVRGRRQLQAPAFRTAPGSGHNVPTPRQGAGNPPDTLSVKRCEARAEPEGTLSGRQTAVGTPVRQVPWDAAAAGASARPPWTYSRHSPVES